MSLGTTTYWNGPFTGDGANATFGFTFPVSATTEVIPLLDGTPASGNFTVALTDVNNLAGGGNVVFDDTFEPASGVEVILIRRVPYLQPTDLTTGYNADAVELAIDRVDMQVQQIESRAMMIADTEVVGGMSGAISGTPSAGSTVLVNADADGFMFGGLVDGAIAVTASWAAWLIQPLTDVISTFMQSALVVTTAHAFAKAVDGSLTLQTKAALAALTSPAANVTYIVRGRAVAGDGGGGTFRWSSADNSANVTLDTNAGVYIPPTSDTSGASGCWIRDVENFRYEVEWFGAVGDGVTDDAAAIQAAITYLSSLASRGGTVGVGLKQYYLGSGLTIDSEGITLEGAGTADMWFPSGWGRSPTELMFGHTNGDAIRCKKSSINIRDLRVNANATRQAASAGSNYGIRFEATDDADASRRVNFAHMHNVHVINQPNHNVCVIGNSVGTLFEQVVSEASIGGHGIVIDCGDQTGRTNKSRPGLAVLDNCRANDNKGHGLCIGHPSNSTNLPYRGIISNFESYRNALTSGARHTAHDGYVFGENIELIACAFSGQDASLTDNVNSGLNFAGRNISLRNGRFVSTNIPITVAAISGVTTRGVIIENPTIAGGTTRPVAVVFESGIGDVRACFAYASGFTAFSTTDSNCTSLHKQIAAAESFSGTRELRQYDDGASVGPLLDVVRHSASPAANDRIGALRLLGKDSAGNDTAYGQIEGMIVDATDTSEDGRVYLRSMQAGTLTDQGYYEKGLVWGAPTGTDKGAGTTNAQQVFEMGRGIWSILAASFVSVNTPADTSEDTLATIAVPANAMGANGLLRVTTLWSYTNSANNKTMRVRFGGTSMFANVVTTTASQQMQAVIANVNATNVQKCFGGGTSFTASTNSISAGAIDTTSSANITITGTKASSGETLTLEGYVVEIFKQA